jgi:tetratricopeptide (TPR) repeat protein
MNDPESVIQKAQAMINHAIWKSTHEQDYSSELSMCSEAEILLEKLGTLNSDLEKLRRRTLSQCLLRIDHALVGLGDNDGSVDRATEALNLAETSGSDVQVARALLSLGNGLLNIGDIENAERNWVRLLLLAEEYPDDPDMNHVIGWTLITRGHVLNSKSLYDQAVLVLEDAESTLESIDDNFGVSAANDLLAKVHTELGNTKKSKQCRLKSNEYRERLRNEPNPYSS